MKRVATGSSLMLLGAIAVAFGLSNAAPDTEVVLRHGVAVPGEIVAIDGDGIAIEYTLARTQFHATAHPSDHDLFAVGDSVMISVLRDDPRRIAIHGTTEASSFAALGLLIAGAMAVIAGGGSMLLQFVSTPVAGQFPLFIWTKERHGGA